MNTKIVYVAISRPGDIYLEQAWASAYTLRHYNPGADITLLTDSDTLVNRNENVISQLHALFNSIVAVSFEGTDFSQMERSRHIKTSLRQLVDGDFVFIDADTYIAGPLDGLDDIACSVGAVPDYHCPSEALDGIKFFRQAYKDRVERVFGGTFTLCGNVYNSGVMLVRDDDTARSLFDRWHRNWLISRSRGVSTDQLSLAKTCLELNYPITEISGNWNCQVRQSAQYLHTAKIVHIFSSPEQPGLSPLFGNSIYWQIKRDGTITEAIAQIILHCKEQILSPSFLLDRTYLNYRYTAAHSLLCKLTASQSHVCKTVFAVIEFLSRCANFTLRRLHVE